jgi:hypothetical protein
MREILHQLLESSHVLNMDKDGCFSQPSSPYWCLDIMDESCISMLLCPLYPCPLSLHLLKLYFSSNITSSFSYGELLYIHPIVPCHPPLAVNKACLPNPSATPPRQEEGTSKVVCGLVHIYSTRI